jgi:hypothetical protein
MSQNKVIQDIISEFARKEQENDKQILNQLAFMVFAEQYPKNDLYVLGKILPEDSLLELIHYYDGAVLRIPTKQDYRDAMLLIMAYWLKEVRKWSWDQIKNELKGATDASMVVLSRKVNELTETLDQRMKEMLGALDTGSEQELLQYLADLLPEPPERDYESLREKLDERKIRKNQIEEADDPLTRPRTVAKKKSKKKASKKKRGTK